MKNVPEWKDKEAQSADIERCIPKTGSPDTNGPNWLNREAPGLKRDAAGAPAASPADQPAD